MGNQIQIFGITASLTVIDTPSGILKELNIVCDKGRAEIIIKEAVLRGMPFQRTSTGVKIFK